MLFGAVTPKWVRGTFSLFPALLLLGAVGACGENGFLVDPVETGGPSSHKVALEVGGPIVVVGDSVSVTATDSSGLTSVGIALFRNGTEAGREVLPLAGEPSKVTVKIGLPLSAEQVGGSFVAVPFATSKSIRSPVVSPDDEAAVEFRVGSGISRPVLTGGDITQILYYPNGNQIVAVDRANHQIVLLDAATGDVMRTVPVGPSPVKATFVPSNNRGVIGDTLVVATTGATSVSLVDLRFRAPTKTLPLSSLTVTTRSAGGTAGGSAVDRSIDAGERPTNVAALCVPERGTEACDELALLVATSPAAVSGRKPLYLVRYLALTGPHAGRESVLTDHIVDHSDKPTTLLDITLRSASGIFSDTNLVTGLPVDLARLEPPAPWALAATRDFSTTMAVNTSDLALGRAFTSSVFAGIDNMESMRDIVANVGGTVGQIYGGGGLGMGGRFAILSAGLAGGGVSLLDPDARMRLSIPGVVGFQFVEFARGGKVSTMAVVVRGAGLDRNIALLDLAGDVVREVSRTPVRGGSGPMAAWLSADEKAVHVAIVDGTDLRTLALPTDR